MTTARTVPVTIEMDGDELDALDAWRLARRHGLTRIAATSFVRFRYGDVFSHSRALALPSCLAVIPFLLALTGLAANLDQERPGPGRLRHDRAGLPRPRRPRRPRERRLGADSSEQAGDLALAVGLALSLASMTAATAQVERGANRIYGIRRDRPAPARYGRAAVLAALLAVPVGVGFLLLVTGDGAPVDDDPGRPHGHVADGSGAAVGGHV